MTKTLSSLVKIFLVFTSVMLIVSFIFEGIIFNLLQILLIGSIFSLAFSLYAHSQEQQVKSKKIPSK
jgi:hypothetical protein